MIEAKDKLHDLPKSWIWTNLESCVEILDNQRIPINSKDRETRKGQIPYYGATGQVGWIDDYLFDEELVLLGEDGAPFLDPHKNKSYIIRGKSWVNNHAHVLRAINGLTINYFIQNYLNIFRYQDYVTGTTRLKLSQAPMRRIPIPLAPIPEQLRIVAKIEELFSRLDAGVEALQKAKVQLKRYRQAVLKAAVEGRLTEEWRKAHHEVKPGEAIGQIEPIVSSELPDLPEGWNWFYFAQLINGSQNGISKRRSNDGDPMHVLRLADIVDYKIFPNTPRDIKLTREEVNKYLIQRGDLLCIRVNGSKNLVGRMVLFEDNDRWAFCDHFIRFKLNKELVLPPYVSNYFNTKIARHYIEFNMVSSAGQNTISQKTLASLPVPLPSIAEQEAIIRELGRLSSISDAIESTLEKSFQLSNYLRQSILKYAFEGKLVPQDLSDEPASMLLERIKAERSSQIPMKSRKNRADNTHQMRLTQ